MKSKEQKISIGTRFLKVEFDEVTRLWSLYETDGEEWNPIIQSAYAQLSLEDGRAFRTDDRQAEVKVGKQKLSDFIGKGKSLQISFVQQTIEFTLGLTIYEQRKALSVQMIMKNRSREALRLNELNLFETIDEGGVRFAEGKAVVSLNGYQSWSPCEIIELDTELHSSYWHVLLRSPVEAQSLLFGFVTNELAVNSFALQRLTEASPVRVRSLSKLRPLELKPAEKISSDRMLIQYESSPVTNLEEYSKALYRFSIGEKKDFLKANVSRSKVATGWCSWYYYHANVTESDIIENLGAAAEHFHSRGLRYIQIDDGYQRAAGDWETNDKFPHGHRWLTDQIHERGFLAGLWVAPFAVGEKSDLFREHQDWLLKNPDGIPLRVSFAENWGGNVYVLDPTIPDVQRWLTKLFRKITHVWKYNYVKIDFLYFAAQGTNYSKPVSPDQAYRMGLEAIRKGAGSKTFILGCGAPLGASVNFVDGMRIGQDVEANWNGILPEAAAAAHRHFYHNKVWFNDPDCLVVREPLTLDQARLWASVVALSGQMNLLSDRLRYLPRDRIEILSKTLPVYGDGTIPVDLYDEPSEYGMTIRNPEGEVFRLTKLLRFREGDDDKWKEPNFDDHEWELVSIPAPWETYDRLKNYDGYGWYRLSFYLPPDWKPTDLTLCLGRVDDCDETYLNGTRIGSTGSMPPEYRSASNLFREYRIPREVVNWKGQNVLSIRVYDGGGQGGIYSLTKLNLPKLWNLRVKKKNGEWNVVGVFNWEGDVEKIEIRFEKLGLSLHERYLVYDFWKEELLGEFQQSLTIELVPTSTRVLSIHRMQARPLILSTSRHITCGAVDLERVEWNEKRLLLSGKSVNVSPGDYTLALWVPDGYQLAKVKPAAVYRGSTTSGSLLEVTFGLKYRKPFNWALEFSRVAT